jgi:hypothetical protein
MKLFLVLEGKVCFLQTKISLVASGEKFKKLPPTAVFLKLGRIATYFDVTYFVSMHCGVHFLTIFFFSKYRPWQPKETPQGWPWHQTCNAKVSTMKSW